MASLIFLLSSTAIAIPFTNRYLPLYYIISPVKVVFGADFNFNFSKMAYACLCLQKNADCKFLATSQLVLYK